MSKDTAKKFWQWLSRQPDNPEADALAKFLDGTDDPDDKGVPPVADFTKSPEYLALKKQLEAQERQLAQFHASTSTVAAAKAVADLKGKFVPAQKPALLALFAQAAQDDADAAVVTFSIEGGEDFKGGRVAALEALFASAPDIVLTTETLDEHEHKAVFAKTKPAESEGLNPYTIAEEYKNKQMGNK